MHSTSESPWRRAFYGIAVLLIVIPGLLIGVSVADAAGDWPPATDVRWILILAGLVVLLGLRLGERSGSDHP